MGKAIVTWVVAALFLIGSVQLFGSDLGAGIFGIVLAAGLAVLGYFIMKKEKAKAAEAARLAEIAAAQALEAEEKKRDYALHHGELKLSVAGVTFENDDGTSRQRILSKFFRENCIDDDDYDVPEHADFKQYEYKGKPAVYVLLQGDIIGNIPKQNLPEFLKIIDHIEDAVIRVSRFKNEEGKLIYYASLNVEYSK